MKPKIHDVLGTPLSSLEDYGAKKRLNYIQCHSNIDNDIILDIGIGYGLYSSILIEKSKYIYGIDLNKENLYVSKKNVDSDKFLPIFCTANKLPFTNDSIDLIICIETYEHLTDGFKVLSEIHRVLKTGGHLITTVPNRLFPFETHGIKIGKRVIGSFGLGFPLLTYVPNFLRNIFSTVSVFTPWNFEKILDNANFKVEKCDYFMPNFDVINRNIPKLSFIINKIQNLLESIERTPLKFFGMTIIYIARCDKT